jgi:hypothetical protein
VEPAKPGADDVETVEHCAKIVIDRQMGIRADADAHL